MSITGLFLHFGIKQVFDASTKEVVGWVEGRFEDASRRMPGAILSANQRAWHVVGLALAEESLGWARDLAREGAVKAARAEIRRVIETTPAPIAVAPAELRARAFGELDRLRGRPGVLAESLFAAGTDHFRRFADPASLADEAVRAAAAVPDAVEPDAPHLACVLRLNPDGSAALFEAMYRYFFRKIAAADDELSRGLTHDRLAALAAVVGARTAGILDQIDVVFDALVTGLKGVETKLDGQTERLDEILRRLSAPPRPGVSCDTDEERAYLRRALAQFRQNPATVGAEAWGRLGAACTGARLYTEASEAHGTAAGVARQTRDPAAEAAHHHAAYLAACEAGDWDRAAAALWKAVEHEPARYRPFDHRRYTPLGILGGGAFGTVFHCLDEYDRDEDDRPRPVAIKSIRTEALDRDLGKVFTEARTLKALGHPGIIGVHDQGFGDPDGRSRPYLVLEFFPGLPLDRHLKEHGRLKVPDFLAVARRVAEAVHAAHTRPKPIFHRDLKPANVMVLRAPDGTWDVKVIDFGLAVRSDVARAGMSVAQANRSTRDKSVTGTMEYAPPEQTGRLAGVEVGPYSDVYAFGKTCLDVLFGTTNPKSWDWATLPADVRAPLQELLERCTADPIEHRHRDFEPVLKTLADLGTPGRTPAPPPIVPEVKKPEPVPPPPQREEPRPLVVPFDRERAKAGQRNWAAYFGVPERRAVVVGEVQPGRFGSLFGRGARPVEMTFAFIPPGTFRMGSLTGEENERPVRQVKLTRGFYLGVHPVTQAQWHGVMGADFDGCRFRGPDRPVDGVSWTMAGEFCRRLTTLLAGKGKAKLPIEAEWEWACRAGTDTEYHTGDGKDALEEAGWYKGNSDGETHPVGRLAANAWGLYDTHGNVWEWVHDWEGEYPNRAETDPTGPASGLYRVLRGGSWAFPAKRCRSAIRNWFEPDRADSRSPGGRAGGGDRAADPNDDIGFRVALTLT